MWSVWWIILRKKSLATHKNSTHLTMTREVLFKLNSQSCAPIADCNLKMFVEMLTQHKSTQVDTWQRHKEFVIIIVSLYYVIVLQNTQSLKREGSLADRDSAWALETANAAVNTLCPWWTRWRIERCVLRQFNNSACLLISILRDEYINAQGSANKGNQIDRIR